MPIRPWGLTALLLYAVLAVGYAFVVVPFEAPDENAHYEYAFLVGELGRPPRASDDRAGLRDLIARHIAPVLPALKARGPDGRPVGFGSLAAVERQPPAYYLLPAFAGRLAGQDVVGDVRAMRLASALLGLGVVAVAGAVGGWLEPTEPFAGRALPLLVALTPGLLFSSASINNDGLAALGGAVAFLGVVGLVRARQIGWLALAALGAAAGLLGKRTALVVAPGALACVWALWFDRLRLPARSRIVVLAASGPAILLVLAVLLGGQGRAAGWQMARHDDESRYPGGRSGAWALWVRPPPAGGGRLEQTVLGARISSPGVLTGGVWARSEDGGPADARLELNTADRSASAAVTVGVSWQFLSTAVEATPGQDASLALIAGSDRAVLFDDAVLVPGRRVGEPTFAGEGALAGQWAGEAFGNLLVNPSGESFTAELRPSAKRVLAAVGVTETTVPALSQLGQPRLLAADEIGARLRHGFETYVGLFGWTTLRLPGLVYGVAAGGLAVGLIGFGFRLARLRAGPGYVVRPAGLFAVGAVLVGVAPYLVGLAGNEFPQGRYLYPAIVPCSALVALGLAAFFDAAHARRVAGALLLGGVAVNLLALWGLRLHAGG